MKTIFIEYPKCSTCKKAKKWLEDNKIKFIDRNIVEETPTVIELTEWIKASGQDIKKFFNTSGLKYKELNLKEKLTTMSDKEKIKLLASDGMLIKRPLLVTDKGISAGFKEDNWKKNIIIISIYIRIIYYYKKSSTKKYMYLFFYGQHLLQTLNPCKIAELLSFSHFHHYYTHYMRFLQIYHIKSNQNKYIRVCRKRKPTLIVYIT